MNRKRIQTMANLLHFVSLTAFLATTSIAHASFILETPSTTDGPVSTNAGPSANPVASDPTRSSQPVHWKMAYGFGNNVPLVFACRQIVPAAVKVTFAPGVNPSAIVNWKGNDTWNHVLRDAVKPLGMHLQMTLMAVEIVPD
jgi:hypothetical protein